MKNKKLIPKEIIYKTLFINSLAGRREKFHDISRNYYRIQ